MEGQIS